MVQNAAAPLVCFAYTCILFFLILCEGGKGIVG